MGCDIHYVIEVKHKNKWVAVSIGEDQLLRNRNYRLFNLLAGVRATQAKLNTPKGFPYDASDTASYLNDHWGSDGHSHSCLLMYQVKKILLDYMNEPGIAFSVHQHQYPIYTFTGMSIKDQDLENYRLVFWFDN